MGFVEGLAKVVTGAAVSVAAVTALPLAAVGMGAIGVATALGTAVGAGIGAAAVVADEIMGTTEKEPPDPDASA